MTALLQKGIIPSRTWEAFTHSRFGKFEYPGMSALITWSDVTLRWHLLDNIDIKAIILWNAGGVLLSDCSVSGYLSAKPRRFYCCFLLQSQGSWMWQWEPELMMKHPDTSPTNTELIFLTFKTFQLLNQSLLLDRTPAPQLWVSQGGTETQLQFYLLALGNLQ